MKAVGSYQMIPVHLKVMSILSILPSEAEENFARGKFRVNINMSDSVGNILQSKFYACCYILLSGTLPKRRYTHTYLLRSYASLGATGRLVPKPRCC